MYTRISVLVSVRIALMNVYAYEYVYAFMNARAYLCLCLCLTVACETVISQCETNPKLTWSPSVLRISVS